jgi:hypothetical protein
MYASMATILRRSYGGAAVSFSSSISLSRRFVSTSSVAVSFPRDSDAIDSFNAIKSYLQGHFVFFFLLFLQQYYPYV